MLHHGTRAEAREEVERLRAGGEETWLGLGLGLWLGLGLEVGLG